MDTIAWLMLFLHFPLAARCIQRCYTTSCPSSPVCIEACQSNDYNCYLNLRPNNLRQYYVARAGCARNSSLSISTFGTPCQIVYFPWPRLPDTYCVCEGDLCNDVRGFSDSVKPVLRIPPLLPTATVPIPKKGQQQKLRKKN